MIKKLTIKNYAIIQEIAISFNNGFTVISGETGAGKSIIIDAINILAGANSNKTLIREGADCAILEAEFDVDDYVINVFNREGIKIDSNKINIKKIISKTNNTKTFINNDSISNKRLQHLSKYLIKIVGQQDNIMLLNSENYIDILDSFGDADHIRNLIKINDTYKKYLELKKELGLMPSDQKEIEQEKDFLEFQIDEINSIDLYEGIDEEYEDRLRFYNNIENIKKELANILNGFQNEDRSVFDSLNEQLSALMSIKDYCEDANAWLEDIIDINERLKDIENSVDRYFYNISYDEEDYSIVQENLDLINKLKYKYGNTISKIFDKKIELENKLKYLYNIESTRANLEEKINLLLDKYEKLSLSISTNRKNIASKLNKDLTKEIRSLNMTEAEFLAIVKNKSELSEKGSDEVIFEIKTNKGSNFLPLYDIISGGEMSRILLALNNLQYDSTKFDTIIFDEIDTGLSGYTANVVAKKLKEISLNKQLIAISHLPQIISIAEYHYLVEKHSNTDNTISQVHLLDNEERVLELARLLSGDKISKKVIENAKELLNRS